MSSFWEAYERHMREQDADLAESEKKQADMPSRRYVVTIAIALGLIGVEAFLIWGGVSRLPMFLCACVFGWCGMELTYRGNTWLRHRREARYVLTKEQMDDIEEGTIAGA